MKALKLKVILESWNEASNSNSNLTTVTLSAVYWYTDVSGTFYLSFFFAFNDVLNIKLDVYLNRFSLKIEKTSRFIKTLIKIDSVGTIFFGDDILWDVSAILSLVEI